jgi:branched-subunit amino acid ABC-type transport system permease component
MERPALTTFKEVAIATVEPEFTAEQIGWRFAIGTLILVGAYIAWPLIPLVVATDLDPGVKTAISGVLGATPFLSKFVAIAVMGRPAYYFLKRTVYDRIRRRAQRESA